MFLSKTKLSQYNKNGYVCFDNIISKTNCSKVREIVKKFQSQKKKKKINQLDKNHPFSSITSNSDKVVILDNKNNEKLNNFINFKKIQKIASFLTKSEMSLWFKKFYPKHSFDGDNEFYHQDYAYHKDKEAKNKEYIQCFIALENHMLGSGCLRVFKGSHKLGLIKHHTVMTRNGVSKLTPSSHDLKKISKKNKLTNLELRAGSCVFFNYNLIHGSSSNASISDQLRMIVQLIKKDNNRNIIINKNVWRKRNQMEIKMLEKFIKVKKKLGQAKN
jgi:ectoine hydroxylase-related dioxygenase (phytanoyl-CoA dioxygenase family)